MHIQFVQILIVIALLLPKLSRRNERPDADAENLPPVKAGETPDAESDADTAGSTAVNSANAAGATPSSQASKESSKSNTVSGAAAARTALNENFSDSPKPIAAKANSPLGTRTEAKSPSKEGGSPHKAKSTADFTAEQFGDPSLIPPAIKTSDVAAAKQAAKNAAARGAAKAGSGNNGQAIKEALVGWQALQPFTNSGDPEVSQLSAKLLQIMQESDAKSPPSRGWDKRLHIK